MYIDTISTTDLVRIYNMVSGKTVARFADRKTALRRVKEAFENCDVPLETVAARLGIVDADPVAPAKAKAPAKPKAKRANDVAPEVLAQFPESEKLTATPVTIDITPAPFTDPVNPDSVLAVILDQGPCPVGRVRELFGANIKGFKHLTPAQQRGRIRRAVIELEETGRVTKEGHLYSAA